MRNSANDYASFRDKIWTRCFKPTQRDWKLLCAVNEQDEALKGQSDRHLADRLIELRTQIAEGGSPTGESTLTTSMAIAKQALRRTIGMSAYDVQILAGIAMARGAIAEMQTGEGKTLASTFPMIAHAITGNGVHVATVNAYLANRDYEFLRPAIEMLGFTVGLSPDGAAIEEKRLAYACDITFATGYELGFDFLRDQIALMARGEDRLGVKLKRELFSRIRHARPAAQRGHALAIIDEIDSVLIDEAITPLVLSSGGLDANVDSTVYVAAQRVANELIPGKDFVVEEKTKTLFLTKSGSARAHQMRDSILRQTPDPHAGNRKSNRSHLDMLADLRRVSPAADSLFIESFALLRPWKLYIESALRARHIMVRDINYVVRDDKIEIVDEYTGRIFADRNWRDGLHQAVEVKENVPVTEEKKTIARISRQRYFQRYDLICGMTGTASGHEKELLDCYRTPIVAIPLRKTSQRIELPTRYFSNQEKKQFAVVLDTAQRIQDRQPVLIGTRTIEQSLGISHRLTTKGIRHQLLNGVQDEDEAHLISIAGCAGSVTVATNMAGRGTDIQLNSEAFEAGGLHVIGLERNSSSRIDRQLLGRAGRQGDPGTGQFYVSADDEIVNRYDPGLVLALRELALDADGNPNPRFDRRIRQIQAIAERERCLSRCAVMQEELWMDKVKKSVG